MFGGVGPSHRDQSHQHVDKPEHLEAGYTTGFNRFIFQAIYQWSYQCLCLSLFCFEICRLYRIICYGEIKMADLTTLKYLSCSLHGQPDKSVSPCTPLRFVYQTADIYLSANMFFFKPGFHSVYYIGTMHDLLQDENLFFGIIHCI